MKKLSQKVVKLLSKKRLKISFEIDFELKNDFLNIVMTKSFQFALDKIADAFQKRAEGLFNKA